MHFSFVVGLRFGMKSILISFFLLLMVLGCKPMPWTKSQSSVLLTIDTNAVSTQEFIYFYNKNNFNSDQIDDKQSIDDYLQLFIKFKLKVREAYALRFDQRSSYQKELEGYRKQLVKPYLSEQRVIDSLVSEGYQRLNKEVKATHILIRLDPRNRDRIRWRHTKKFPN